jgi:pimeloyl-ACP methyl ester carboxylesterase
VRLHAIEGGPPDGPLVILLHGFPEMHLAWRHQLQPLVNAGFRVLAPDLRGYGLSDKPVALDAYTLDAVGDDVVAVMRACDRERAHVVAHDWGGAVAWHLAHKRPAHLETLTILNSPHPRLFLKRMRGIEQFVASWYMFAFQLPLAERLLARRDFATLKGIFRTQPRIKGAYDDEDLRAYRESWEQPGALTAMLAWYRTAMRGARRSRGGDVTRDRVTVPTLVFWGMDDEALPPGNLDGLEDVVENLKIVRLPNCSHWVMHDAPRIVNRELLTFLRVHADA